jgi:hypothetical protein
LFRSEQIEYLVVGGYAVAYHGYPRATGDMDVWVAINPQNAAALSRALTKFGFSASAVPDTLFLQSNCFSNRIRSYEWACRRCVSIC